MRMRESFRRLGAGVRRYWIPFAAVANVVSTLLLWHEVFHFSAVVTRSFLPVHGETVVFQEDFPVELLDLYASRSRGIASVEVGWSRLSPQGIVSLTEDGDDNWVLHLERDASCDTGSVTGISIPINGAHLRGETIQLRAWVRGNSITRGNEWFDVGQCNLYYSVPGGTAAPSQKRVADVWEAVRNLEGTFGWNQVVAVADTTFHRSQTPRTGWIAIPADAYPDMNLTVSLQSCVGILEVDWIEIVVMKQE